MHGSGEEHSREEEMRRVVLIGYMGAGKTTIGHALSKDTGMLFYDLDWYIENRMRKKISQIFENSGEEGFRQIERNMLHEVAEFENVIVSCGGGTPCFFDNMEYLNRQADTVYLKASPEVLCEHLKMGRTVRPLLIGKSDDELLAYITEQLKYREQYYSQSKYVLNVNLLDSREKISTSIEHLREMLGL